LLAFLAILALDEPVRAQAPSQQDCRMPAAPSQQQPGAAQDGADHSRKLDTCNGVLDAPSVGDGEMVEPAPSTGNQRVIMPETLPPGGNPSNGSGG
jgi:hypothetical protein